MAGDSVSDIHEIDWPSSEISLKSMGYELGRFNVIA
jgi:hypothetical protein